MIHNSSKLRFALALLAFSSGGISGFSAETFQRVRSISRLLTLVLSAVAIITHVNYLSAQPNAYILPSMDRIAPDTAPRTTTFQSLYAAKGEYESFQIAVFAPTTGLTNLDVTAPNLVGPNGAIIPASAITMYREHFVYISEPALQWGTNLAMGPGWYPDGLIPFVDPVTKVDLNGALDAVPYTLAANKNAVFWVDILVPRTVPAGNYTGTFTVTSTEGIDVVDINLRVWNFAIPLKPALKSSFIYWRATNSLAATTSQRTKETNEELLRNRVMPAATAPSFEREFIDQFGLTTNGIRGWSGADAGNCTMNAAPTSTAVTTEKNRHHPSIYLVNHIADEIGHCSNLIEPVKQWARALHAGGIDVLITMPPTPLLFDDDSGTSRSAVDVWVVLPKQYDAVPHYIEQAIAKGDEVWSYNTLMQDEYSPKWQVDFAPINFRVQPGFINQSLNLSGLSYWRVDYWNADPWENIQNHLVGTYWYRGDGILVYPGAKVGMVGAAPSMRLKWIRDGVDDYDYIDLLKKAGQGAFALQVARTVGPDWRNWTRDPTSLEEARIQLGNELERLSGGSIETYPSSTRDTQSPVLTITSPAEGATIAGVTSVTATATDNVDVTHVEIYVDNVLRTTLTNAPFTYSLDTRALTNGSQTIRMVAYDSASNMGVLTRTVTIDNATCENTAARH